jgi:hypothetical protein
MGFFSWLTSDTEESIANVHTGRERTVYLLQPDGQDPICEPAYDGYGEFGGVDAYAWLAEVNAPMAVINGKTDDEIRSLGITMAEGVVYRDVQNGDLWSVRQEIPQGLGVPVRNFPHSALAVIPELGMSANDLEDCGRFKRVRLRDYLDIKFPLKLSFDKDAVYETLPAAKNCPHQGYFFSDMDDEDDLPIKPKTINTMKF